MFKQTLTTIRPNKNAPFFHEAPEHATIQQMRTLLREMHPEMVLSRTTTISSDELTFTNILTFPSQKVFNRYVKLLKTTIPNWPKVRNDYYAANGHMLIAEGKVDSEPTEILYTL
jgi:hypothetical protein